jgi:hypothetical protein
METISMPTACTVPAFSFGYTWQPGRWQLPTPSNEQRLRARIDELELELAKAQAKSARLQEVVDELEAVLKKEVTCEGS